MTRFFRSEGARTSALRGGEINVVVALVEDGGHERCHVFHGWLSGDNGDDMCRLDLRIDVRGDGDSLCGKVAETSITL